MSTLAGLALKRLAWRHKGKLLVLAAVAVLLGLFFSLLTVFMVHGTLSSSFTIFAASDAVCETSGPGGSGGSGGPNGPNSNANYVPQEPSNAALSDIPADYLPIYRQTAEAEGLDWTVLAGVGKVESDHGRNTADSYAGAQGPMQFMPPTWEDKGVDGNGDGTADVRDPEDAIPAAARYLKELGAPGDYRDALCQYNAGPGRACASYPEDVLGHADTYRAAESEGDPESVPALISPQRLGRGGGGGGAGPLLTDLSLTDLSLTDLSPAPAGATQNSWDRVDENMNLHYEESTDYDEALQVAVDEWNALGTVKVSPSPSPEETDIWIADAYDGETGAASGGLASSDGEIWLHAPNMSDNTLDQNVGIVGHEIGHALGFDHPPSDNLSIMDSPPDTGYVTDYDKQEYYARHGQPQQDSGGGGEGGSGPNDSSGPNGGPNDGGTPTGNDAGGRAVFPLPEDYFDSYENDYQTGGHEAVDLSTPEGTPVRAVVGGTVVEIAGATPDGNTENDGYAVMVEAGYDIGPIRTGDTLYYANLQGPASISDGDTVEAGQQIGAAGTTAGGEEAGLHLGWYDPTGKRADSAAGAMNPYPMLEWLVDNGGEVGQDAPLVAPGACPEEEGGGPGGGGPGSGGPGSGPRSYPGGSSGDGITPASAPYVQEINKIVQNEFGITGTTYANHGSTGEAYALDFLAAPEYGSVAEGEFKAFGDELARFFEANWDDFNVVYIIWYDEARWSKDAGWTPYDESGYSGGSNDPESMQHFDHVHVSFDNNASAIGNYQAAADLPRHSLDIPGPTFAGFSAPRLQPATQSRTPFGPGKPAKVANQPLHATVVRTRTARTRPSIVRATGGGSFSAPGDHRLPKRGLPDRGLPKDGLPA